MSATPTAVVAKTPVIDPRAHQFGPLPPELWPKVDQIITEDDTPVDNFYSEKQQKLLTRSLHATLDPFGHKRPFIAVANVGLYSAPDEDPQVPDVMVSLDVTLAEDIWQKGNRAYLIWLFHKPPEVAIEIVSNKIGGEDSTKKDKYAQMRVAYYVIHDPAQRLSKQVLRVYELRGTRYVLRKDAWLPDLGIGLLLQQGTFEKRTDTWLRWYDRNGDLLLTGEERAEQEHQRAQQAEERVEQERQRAQQAEERNAQLIAHLQKLGIDPNQIK